MGWECIFGNATCPTTTFATAAIISIIKYSDGIEGDLSWLKYKDFIELLNIVHKVISSVRILIKNGLKNDADLTNINLAYILEDGEKIYIPKKGEIIDDTNSISDLSSTSSFSIKNNKININKATQTELETIPGIGPSTALKILD